MSAKGKSVLEFFVAEFTFSFLCFKTFLAVVCPWSNLYLAAHTEISYVRIVAGFKGAHFYGQSAESANQFVHYSTANRSL